jgi:Bacterial regulatory proteins, gntR family
VSLHAGPGSGVVLLSPECRPLRLELRSLVWVVLEEIALDAVLEDGRLMARTSARQVAEHLGVNPNTAAEALRGLARRGLVSLAREKGLAGRFGLSVYELRPPAGLTVLRPCAAEPCLVSSRVVQAEMPGAAVVSSWVAASHSESSKLEGPVMGRTGTPAVKADPRPAPAASDPDGIAAAREDGSPRGQRRSTPSPRSSGYCPGQTALDLGTGNA